MCKLGFAYSYRTLRYGSFNSVVRREFYGSRQDTSLQGFGESRSSYLGYSFPNIAIEVYCAQLRCGSLANITNVQAERCKSEPH